MSDYIFTRTIGEDQTIPKSSTKQVIHVESGLTGDKDAYELLESIKNDIKALESYFDISGSANTANSLKNNMKLSATGDVTGNVSFDGSKDVSIQLSLKNIGDGGTYGVSEDKTLEFGGSFPSTEVTVDKQGRVTSMSERTVTLPSLDLKTGYTENGNNYPVRKDTDGNMYVAVPWNDTEYSVFTPSTATADGVQGLVPAPSKSTNPEKLVLSADGTWKVPTNESYEFSITDNENGINKLREELSTLKSSANSDLLELTTKVNTNSETLSSQEDTINDMQTQISGVATESSTNTSNIASLSVTVSGHDTKISNHGNAITNLKAQMSNLESDMSNLKKTGILYGTTVPTASQGENGNIYIKYTV